MEKEEKDRKMKRPMVAKRNYKHRQVRTNKWSVWYNGEYRGTVWSNGRDPLDFLPVEKFPEREKISLVPIVIEE